MKFYADRPPNQKELVGVFQVNGGVTTQVATASSAVQAARLVKALSKFTINRSLRKRKVHACAQKVRRLVLAAYDEYDLASSMVDALTDLMHLADVAKLDFQEDLLRMAANHYNAETRKDKGKR